jgi:L-ascorbate metabolism protein UlaG (beta-lactamase superfamily)
MPGQLIKPLRKDSALLADVRAAAADQDAFHLWWLGQSGFLLQWKGSHVLLDPYLSDSLTKKYAQTEKPHVRMTERVIDPGHLNFIHIVTSSHNHTDHLDSETLIPLLQVNPTITLVIPEANRDFVAARVKTDRHVPVGLNDGERVTLQGFTFTAVPAAHETVERDEAGRCKFLGYVLQFGPWTVYHSGDTMWYEGMEEVLSGFSIDVAILPINGRDPRRKVAGNLSGAEAARVGKRINARTVIPCHYDMFTFNTADPADFAREATTMGQPYQVLQAGERWSSRQLP